MLEKDLESWCVKYTREHYIAKLVKFTSPNNKGVPDRILLAINATICFIEFKKPGGKPTKLQKIKHEELRELGFTVYVCDSRELFKEICRTELAHARRS